MAAVEIAAFQLGRSMPKTTFIIGAGANAGLDSTNQLPIGSQLALRIQQKLGEELATGGKFPQGDISNAISHAPGGFTESHLRAMERIEKAIVFKDSIDDLIDEWSDNPIVSEVAKVCIAQEILLGESTTGLWAAINGQLRPSTVMRAFRDHWIGQVLRYANQGARRRDARSVLSDIKFVTFNYDRCLELALYFYLTDSQDFSKKDAIEIIRNIGITHAYGSLGVPEQLEGPRKFGGRQAIEPLLSAREIRTYTEEQDSGHVKNLRDTVNDSENIVFLGFGYHPRNLELLFGGGAIDIPMFGSCTAMTPEQKNAAADRISPICSRFVFRE